jgi:hypothetical protein
MLRTIIIAAAAALLAAGATALAGTSHVLGNGGTVYKFDAQCHRVSFIPPGISTKEGLNVVAQQTRCLVRRPDPFARCVHHLGAAPSVVGKFDHGDGKPGDWSGVDKLQAYVAAVTACSTARY